MGVPRVMCARFPGYRAPEEKGAAEEFDAGALRDRIFGAHVSEYMESMEEEDEQKYQAHFAKYIEAGIGADDVEDMYKEGAKLFTRWLKTSLKKQGRQSFATLQTQIDKLATKAKGEVEGDVSKKAIAKLRAMALTRALERETAYDLNGGKIATVRKALAIDPTLMAKELNDIEYLLSALEKAQEPFTKTTWSDTVDSWLGMRDLIKKLESERAQHVLDCIFSDNKVREALGGAVMFTKIANPDAVPDGLLIKLKAGPGHHIKERYYDYVKALKTEMAHIERLQSLQKQATGLIGIGLLATATAAGNFVGGLFSNKLLYDEWAPDLQPEQATSR